MPTAATLGHGTLFQIGNGMMTETFTTIGEVLSVTGPNMNMTPVDVTNMDSANAIREYIAGLRDSGEVTVTVNFLPDNTAQTQVVTDYKARTKRNFKITWTDSTPATWSFAAFITNIEPNAVVDDRLQASLTMKLTGDVTIA